MPPVTSWYFPCLFYPLPYSLMHTLWFCIRCKGQDNIKINQPDAAMHYSFFHMYLSVLHWTLPNDNLLLSPVWFAVGIILLHNGFDKLELVETRKVPLDKSESETDTCIMKFSLCCMIFLTLCNSGYLVSGLHHGGTTYWTDTLPWDRPYPSTSSPLLLQCISEMAPCCRFSMDLGQVMDECALFSVYNWCTLTYDRTSYCSLHSGLSH